MNALQASVTLKKGRAQPLWQKHPWVYTGAIQQVSASAAPGQIVSVYDHDRRLIGLGYYNPNSQIAVRMLTYKDEPLDLKAEEHLLGEKGFATAIFDRIHQAALLRKRIGLPSVDTNAYRLVHSEGDRLPGLTVDMYADTAVVQFTTLGIKLQEEAVYTALKELPSPYRPHNIVEVAAPRFAQLEGFSAITQVIERFSSQKHEEIESMWCKEGGLSFQVSPLGGQKTGMFLDQRENRIRLGGFSKGLRVLDLYSYMGGFSLQALRQGATSAVCVDSSKKALQKVELHAKENQLPTPETIEMDAFRYLETVTPYSFDVVVLDPPKFASAQKDMNTALKGYRRLNALAMQAVKPQGILATCSCSQLVDPQSFERMIASAAVEAGRNVVILESRSQGPDHPVAPGFSEGSYLKFVLLSVS